MHSAPGQQDGQQDHARDDVEGIKPPSPPPTVDSGIATRYDPVGYIHHDDDEAADTAPTSGITSGAAAAAGDATSDTASNTTDTNTFANTGSTPSVLAEAVKDGVEEDEDEDDAVDDSEDLDEESTNVRKTTSFYRRRHSMSDTRLQDVMGFPFRPLVRPLTISDLDSCEALEKSAFSAEHAASREKFEYRLSTCPELCLGLFCTVVPSIAKKHGFDIETLDTAKPVETGRPDGALSVLVAHIVSTKCIGDLVTDESMDYPRDFRTNKTSSSSGRTEAGASTGHQPQGNTVALHSLAVHPRLHGCGLGKLIVKAYLQHVKGASLADRVSLICQDYLVTYYAKHGFANMGKSTATYGGGGWFDMTIEIGNGNGIGK